MGEDKVIKNEYDDYSREQLIDEIKDLKKHLEIGRGQFRDLEERVIGANNEIEFLRQVIMNLTKK